VRDVLDDQLSAAARLPIEPSLVTVAAGANDIRRGRRRELAPALERLLASLPQDAVVGTIPGRPAAVEPFNVLIRERARERGVRVAETATAITPPFRGKLASDFFHPNDAGYAAWAAAFAAALPAIRTH
jgi:lysophospholipase L1-like esterase